MSEDPSHPSAHRSGIRSWPSVGQSSGIACGRCRSSFSVWPSLTTPLRSCQLGPSFPSPIPGFPGRGFVRSYIDCNVHFRVLAAGYPQFAQVCFWMWRERRPIWQHCSQRLLFLCPVSNPSPSMRSHALFWERGLTATPAQSVRLVVALSETGGTLRYAGCQSLSLAVSAMLFATYSSWRWVCHD